jgi:hypothetical protein
MDKYTEIEKLYARKSDLNLTIITLEEKIARSADYHQNKVDLQQLGSLHSEMTMIQYEIMAVIEAPKRSALRRLFTNI